MPVDFRESGHTELGQQLASSTGSRCYENLTCFRTPERQLFETATSHRKAYVPVDRLASEETVGQPNSSMDRAETDGLGHEENDEARTDVRASFWLFTRP
jgi:hypothetical protein